MHVQPTRLGWSLLEQENNFNMMTIKTIKHKVNKNGNYDWYCKHEILKGRQT